MSNMKELYDKVAQDSALQQKFNTILKDAERAGQTATEEKLLAFAKEVGYLVSLEEMKVFFEGMSTQASTELSDAELDQVAGGKVQQGTVIASVFTLGLVCAIGSIIDAIQGNCEEFFHREIKEGRMNRP